MILINNTIITKMFRTYIKKNFPQTKILIKSGTLIIKVSFLKIHRLAFFLKNHTQCQFKILSDITATHHLNNISSLVIIYSLLSVTYNTRLLLYLSLEKEPFNLISLSPIYAVANWFEREIWDFFGIYFIKHNDLRRILTDYGFKGHPLRKDFPLTGFIEIRYIHNEKRILTEEISLAQDYRIFYFNNTWNI